ALSPLPAQRYELRNYKYSTVQPMGYIYLSEDKHYYSVPFKHVGRKVETQYTTRSVEVFYGNERIAIHPRDYSPGRYTSIADHLSSSHHFLTKWSPGFFQKWARGYGVDVEHYRCHRRSWCEFFFRDSFRSSISDSFATFDG
ncbi:MAG: hypothetical protein ACI9XB_005257, partial [Gammaproteobacteria bacterium]